MCFKFNMEICFLTCQRGTGLRCGLNSTWRFLFFLQIGKGHVTERDVYTEFHRYTWCSMGTFNTELEQGWTN